MGKRLTIAEALQNEMIKGKAKRAWAGDPDLLLAAYEASGGSVRHPMDRIAAVISAARRSNLFQQGKYIRACDSSGRREILHPCFELAQPAPDAENS